jgi:hypothetical protein
MKLFRQLFPGLMIFAIALAYCYYMAANHSFHARCVKVYDENTAAFERCVARTSGGGPVFEENIGKL